MVAANAEQDLVWQQAILAENEAERDPSPWHWRLGSSLTDAGSKLARRNQKASSRNVIRVTIRLRLLRIRRMPGTRIRESTVQGC